MLWYHSFDAKHQVTKHSPVHHLSQIPRRYPRHPPYRVKRNTICDALAMLKRIATGLLP